ncbi:ABC transporter permease [Treponema primitia]|uniref:ABC transporter permease n=1 Tax=Treponema primitia TaxID=88058 RepID=UPI0002554CCD|nr:ABC transporter permease [Treponema primitia]
MLNLFKIREDISRRIYITVALLAFAILFGAWTFFSVTGLVKATILPSPMAVLTYFIRSIRDGSLWSNMSISIFRILMGFFLAVVVGVPLGILCGAFRIFESFIQSICEFIRYMPVPAFIPLIMVWVGIGEEAKITVIFIGTLFQIIPMAADNVRAIPEDLINAAYTLGTGRGNVIMKVIVPAIMPKLFETMRMMIGWAWTYLIVAELVAANSGLGYAILKAQRVLKTEAIFTGILVIGILGIATDRLFALMTKKSFPWVDYGSK